MELLQKKNNKMQIKSILFLKELFKFQKNGIQHYIQIIHLINDPLK